MKFVITDKETKAHYYSTISGCDGQSVEQLYNQIKDKDVFFVGPNGEEIKFCKENFDFDFIE